MEFSSSSTESERALAPEDLPKIFHLLSQSLNPHIESQKNAENQLKTMEHRPNFCSCLLEIISQKDADHSARWLASVYFKNIVSKQWRARLRGAINEDEKVYIRQKTLGELESQENQIATQMAVALAKIGRVDFPTHWPTLFQELLGRIERVTNAPENQNSDLIVKRNYLGIHLLLKELSSKRLSQDQRNFESLSKTIFPPIWEHWGRDITLVVKTCLHLDVFNSVELESDTLSALERTLLQLKCIRRLMVFGFGSDAKTLNISNIIGNAVPIIAQQFSKFLEISSALEVRAQDNSQLGIMIQRNLVKLLKTLMNLQEVHPWAFFECGSLLPFAELLCQQASNPLLSQGNIGLAYKKYILLSIFGILKCPGYRGSTSSLVISAGQAKEQKQKLENFSAKAKEILISFWATHGPPLLADMVSRYFPLTKDELDLWYSNGEELHQELEHTAKEENIRGCAELVFVALLGSNRESFAQSVLSLMQQITLVPESQIHLSSIKEVSQDTLDVGAILYALAVGAYDLYDYIDFDLLLSHAIAPLLSADNPVLLRSALKLVSYWIPKLKLPERPTIYLAVIQSLQNNDPGIYLMACSVLQALLEDWDFDPAQFMHLVPKTVNILLSILCSCTEYESQLEVFSLLNLVVDHMEGNAMECAPHILNLIPTLWTSSEGQSLLKIQIMLALQRLVHVLGPNARLTYPVVFPILSSVIDKSSADVVNLLEDAVLLWLVTFRHAPSPESCLLAPMSNFLCIMDESTEHILTGSRIISSCALLFGDDFIRHYGTSVCSVFSRYMGTIRDKAMLNIIYCVDTIVQACPKNGIDAMQPLLVGLILDDLSDREPANVVAASLTVFSRLAIRDASRLVSIFEFASETDEKLVYSILSSKSTGTNLKQGLSLAENLFSVFLDVWIEKFDAIGATFSRKLSALAFCSLLKLYPSAIIERFDRIAAHVTSVWYEIEGPEAEPDPLGLSFPIAGTGPRDDMIPVAVDLEEAEAEPTRRREMFERDPVQSLRIGKCFSSAVQEVTAVHGEQMHAAMNSMDPSIAKHVNEMISKSLI